MRGLQIIQPINASRSWKVGGKVSGKFLANISRRTYLICYMLPYNMDRYSFLSTMIVRIIFNLVSILALADYVGFSSLVIGWYLIVYVHRYLSIYVQRCSQKSGFRDIFLRTLCRGESFMVCTGQPFSRPTLRNKKSQRSLFAQNTNKIGR